jgi:hypothetical protein
MMIGEAGSAKAGGAILLCLGLWFASALAAGQTDAGLLRAEFWADLEPVAKPGEEWPVPSALAARRLLEEAAWTFAGMIWGFEFEYRPLDRARGIEERFVARPLGAIAFGDSRLTPGPASTSLTTMRAFVEYRPSEADRSAIESYRLEPWKPVQGMGKADYMLGVGARRLAYEDALRSALREHFRSLEPNKPRLVRGRAVFERPPGILLREGYYTVSLRARAELLEILPFAVY